MACNRQHQNKVAVLLVDILLGWTVIGWIAAMALALTAVERPTTSHHYY